MANIITINDTRTSSQTRPLAVGDTIMNGNVSSGNPVMIVAVGTDFGLFDIMSATVICAAPTIKDCLITYKIINMDNMISIIPGENVDVSLVGDKNAGANITLPV